MRYPISLRQGDEVSLNYVKNLRVKLSWNVPHKSNWSFFANCFSENTFECNAYMLMYQEEYIADTEDIISYCNSEHHSKSLKYLGKCVNDKGGVSEIMLVNLDKVPLKYDAIVFIANIAKAISRGQDFGMINKAYIQITNEDTNKKICRYDLAGRYDDMNTVFFGGLFRCKNGWEFAAIGEGTMDDSLEYMLTQFSQSENVAIAL